MALELDMITAAFHFNRVANAHVRAAAELAGEAAARQPSGQWFGSLFDVMAHIARAEHTWLTRLREGATPGRQLDAADFADLPALLAAWQDLDLSWQAYVTQRTAAQVAAAVRWRRTNGEEMSRPLWQVLLHVTVHGAEHRAQAALILTNLGIPHGEMDFNPNVPA